MAQDIGARRAAFWAALAEQAPEFGLTPGIGGERELAVGGRDDLRLKLSLSQDKSSVYLVARSASGRAFVEGNSDALARALRTVPGQATREAGQGRWFRKDNPRACFTVQSQWPEALRWFRAQQAAFDRAVRTVAEQG
jgi:hypothetical protein